MWLSNKNWNWKTGCRKLAPKWCGPFKVVEVLGPVTYRLELPHNWQIHDVFHVSLLKAFNRPPKYRAPAPVRVVDGKPEWEVHDILRHRQLRGREKEYLIHWKGYGPEWQSWQPESDLTGAKGALQKYWKKVQVNPNYGKVAEPVEIQEE